MIRIEHIKAHLPEKQCQIRFLLKAKNQSCPEELCKNTTELTSDFIDVDLEHIIDVSSMSPVQKVKRKNKKLKKKQTTVVIVYELCAICVTEKDKIYIGHIEIKLDERLQHHFQELQGLDNQDGFIIYSIFPDGVQQKIKRSQKEFSPYIPDNSPTLEDQFKKIELQPEDFRDQSDHTSSLEASAEDHSVQREEVSKNVEYEEESNEERQPRQFTLGRDVENTEAFIKKTQELQVKVEQQQNKQQISNERQEIVENPSSQQILVPECEKQENMIYQIEMMLIHEKLLNQQYWNRIQQNQIFQLQIKKRLEGLLQAK